MCRAVYYYTWIRREVAAQGGPECPAEAGLSHFRGSHVNLTFGEVNVECADRREISESPVIIGG